MFCLKLETEEEKSLRLKILGNSQMSVFMMVSFL